LRIHAIMRRHFMGYIFVSCVWEKIRINSAVQFLISWITFRIMGIVRNSWRRLKVEIKIFISKKITPKISSTFSMRIFLLNFVQFPFKHSITSYQKSRFRRNGNRMGNWWEKSDFDVLLSPTSHTRNDTLNFVSWRNKIQKYVAKESEMKLD
jgi:hypothetical protein